VVRDAKRGGSALLSLVACRSAPVPCCVLLHSSSPARMCVLRTWRFRRDALNVRDVRLAQVDCGGTTSRLPAHPRPSV
jgi:hypothetical protein